jgi:hypothetical protein
MQAIAAIGFTATLQLFRRLPTALRTRRALTFRERFQIALNGRHYIIASDFIL